MGLLSPSPKPAPLPDGDAAHANARDLLRRFNFTCLDVIAVDADSILFRGAGRLPRTAWIGVRDERVVCVVCEDGFNPEPNQWTASRLARECSADTKAPA